ncbi:phage neck terminator protein [Gellertiella hungarica]|uniref:Phage neck terminator protein gp12-like domain-containing protein n=1 Tax=Gellertiella hungarica TaxID=1572859 RepID=A0A7W6NJS7_9HYPH|nr:hypothetical protein [Gellertiella hungarica]MBB4063685.1 hypothetical protein [Gellertiella hungarica]
MTEDQVISAVVRFVARVTGVKAIRAHEGGQAPALPYVMVNLIGMSEIREHPTDVEFTDTGQPNTSGKNIINAAPVIEIEWRFSVHAYGPNPASMLRPVLSAMKLAQVMEPAMPGLIFFDASAIRSIPEWVNNQWEPRAQVDLFARAVIRDAFAVDVVDTTSFDAQPMA